MKMSVRLIAVLAVTALVLPPDGAVAQQRALAERQRVRVSAPDLEPAPMIGRVEALLPNGLVLHLPDRVVEVPGAAIRRVEVSDGFHRRTVQGAIVGGVTAPILLIGALLAFKPEDSETSGCPFFGASPTCTTTTTYSLDPGAVMVYSIGAASIGAMIGALMGRSIEAEGWIRVSPPWSGDR